MVEPQDTSPLERFCVLFTDAGVEFMIVGGQAEALMGSPRVTYDFDFCYRRSSDNLEKLAGVLKNLKLTLRGAPPDLKFRVDTDALKLGSNFTFEVDDGYPLDLLAYLEPIGTYEDLLPGADELQIAGRSVKVIGLDDLIRIKRYLGRPKDRESLLQLEAIKRIRNDEGE